MDAYEPLRELGQGTFGVVVQAEERQSRKLVALKKFVVHDRKEGFPITAFREITILRKLHHENVIQVLRVLRHEGSFYTVAPYVTCDLNGLVRNSSVVLDVPQQKCMLWQLLMGLNYVHSMGYLHRDVKTANILLDYGGTIKLADFGLARVYHGGRPSANGTDVPKAAMGGYGGFTPYTPLVVTRWYRAPELLLGDRKYTTSIDLWGVGCILAELFIKRPLFEGRSDIHQAELIFQMLGTPTPETYPKGHLVNANGVNLKVSYRRTLEATFGPILGNVGVKLLAGLLELDPERRLNAQGALAHDWFTTEPRMATRERLRGLQESHEGDVPGYEAQIQGKQSQPHNFPPPYAPSNQTRMPAGRPNEPRGVQAARPWREAAERRDQPGPRATPAAPAGHSKRDREDPYYVPNTTPSTGKRQRPAQRRGPLYGTSKEDEQKRLGMLRGMLKKGN